MSMMSPVTWWSSMRQFQDVGHWSNVQLCGSNPDVRRLQSISFISFVGAWTNVWLHEAALLREHKQGKGRCAKKCAMT